MTLKQLLEAKKKAEAAEKEITKKCGCIVTERFIFACDTHAPKNES